VREQKKITRDEIAQSRIRHIEIKGLGHQEHELKFFLKITDKKP
jgi:hypothetical protein